MEQFLNKYVRYTGSAKMNLEKTRIYPVSHTYSGNVTLRVAWNKFVSVSPNCLQIIDTDSIPLNDNIIEVHSVLYLDNDLVGVRFSSRDVPYFDIEIDKLGNLQREQLSRYKVEHLQPFVHLLMTEAEYKNNMIVLDLSNNDEYCKFIKVS